MKIENRNGDANISFIVSDIEGDMGEAERLFLLVQADGDVVIGISTPRQLYSIEFCTSNGGGRRPIIAKKLRELVAELVKAQQI